MKLLLFTCCFLLLVSCHQEKKEPQKPTFLIGDWVRINDKEGSITYETWHTNLKGLGYTLKEKDTTFKEKLNIVTINDILFLKVEGVNKNETCLSLRNKHLLLLFVKIRRMSFQKR
ncbi:hypothetical protein [Polaribacter atrinae]|uniref:hypothetical protein n=1 Tax=Polaribacter atrinae TaxID=1333662 RepID=UPI0030F59F5C